MWASLGDQSLLVKVEVAIDVESCPIKTVVDAGSCQVKVVANSRSCQVEVARIEVLLLLG